MRVPRFFFRNVRSEPKKFKFRSPHYRPEERELEERKKRLDAEIALEKGEQVDDAPPQRVSLRSRRKRRAKNNLWANLRVIIILVILLYLLYRGVMWVETTDFGKVLEPLKNG